MKKSRWDSDYQLGRPLNFGDGSERSTSAPPPETSFLFGQKEIMSPVDRNSASNQLNPLYEREPSTGNWHSPVHNPCARTEVPSSYEKPPPGFGASPFSNKTTLASSLTSNSGDAHLGSRERRSIGECLIRSQSAAPSFDAQLTSVTPPGLAHSNTPLASNTSHPHIQDDYLGSITDKPSIQELGQRRSSSTGVIGQHQHVPSFSVLQSLGLSDGAPRNDTVRPAAKTLMDLIQEDCPPESTVLPRSFAASPGGGMYADTAPRVEAPQPSQPLYIRQQLNENQRMQEGRHVLNPQTVFHPRGQYPDISNAAGASYVQHSNGQPQPLNVQPQQVQFQTHQGYPGLSQPNMQMPPAQVLQPGQQLYMNGAPAQYAYATLQYPQQGSQQQQHIIQAMPNGEHYVSVVPIQGGMTTGPHGSFPYWQSDGQSPGGGQPTVTIVDARGPGGVPFSLTRVGTSDTPSQRKNHQNGGRSNKEKGGKQRRSNGRRSTEPKQQPGTRTTETNLLEELKSKRGRDWTAKEIKGHVVEFCQDQNGSRFIQQRIEQGTQKEKDIIMAEVFPAVRRLRNDVFGNYVVQKLFEFGTSEMRLDFLETLEGEMLHLSMQMYGCRVVQKALETLDETELPKLLTEFHNNVLSLVHDQNGNHVIQKCIEVICAKAENALLDGDQTRAAFLSEQIEFIVDDILGNVVGLSKHPYGCRILQRILEHCVDAKKKIALDKIAKCHKTLLDDQYGNYVIQHVLQFGRHDDRESILSIVVENGLLKLARQKFASNVVEKLLKYGSSQQRKAVVREMLKNADDVPDDPADDSPTDSVVFMMVQNAYANYVVQTALDVIAESEEKRMLTQELKSRSLQLKNFTFAKHILTKIGA